MTGHFGDESLQTMNCTGTDNQTITKRKYTKHKNNTSLHIHTPPLFQVELEKDGLE